MSCPLRYLDRAAIREGFGMLAAELAAHHLIGSVYLFGGGAMVMAFDDREATRDLDARLMGDMQGAIAAVAGRMAWPRSWLDEQSTVHLLRSEERHPTAIFDHPNLRVLRVSDRHVLAMKAAAARGALDLDDLRRLVRHLDLRSPDEAVAIHATVFPDDPLGRRRLAVIAAAFPPIEGRSSVCGQAGPSGPAEA